MKAFISIVGIGLIIASCTQLQTVENAPVDASRSIVKVQAISPGGKQNLGSGVVIAPNTIATNCHVIRTASRAFLVVPEGLYPVIAQTATPEFDVCMLKTEHLDLPAPEIAESDSVKIGDEIVLSGYPFALGLRASRGKVTGLHPYGKDQIIEINTGFNHGASGGGVFDNSGKLIGLMTFMGPEADAYHFYAIPATWLAMGLEQEFRPLKPFTERSFWEKGEFVKKVKK